MNDLSTLPPFEAKMFFRWVAEATVKGGEINNGKSKTYRRY